MGVVDDPAHVLGLVPGGFYFGTLTSPERQASHARDQDTLLDGHSFKFLSIIYLRALLLKHDNVCLLL